MKLWLPLLLFTLIGYGTSASAEVSVMRNEMQSMDGLRKAEVFLFTTENEKDVEEVVKHLAEVLQNDQKENPNLVPYFEVITKDASRSPSAQDPSITALEKVSSGLTKVNPIKIGKLTESDLRALKKPGGNWFRRNASSLTFALVRASLSGGITFVGTMASSNLSVLESAAVSVLSAGLMSGYFMFENEKILQWLGKNEFGDKIRNVFLRKAELAVEPYVKWWTMEVGFLTLYQVALAIAGAPPEHGILTAVGVTAFTALKTVFSQGALDVAVGKDMELQKAPVIAEIAQLEIELEQATNLRAPQTQLSRMKEKLDSAVKRLQKITFITNVKTMAISAFSVGAAIADLSGLPIGNWTFGTMAAAGIIYSVKLAKPEWFCRNTVKRSKPAKQGEEDVELIVIHDPKKPKHSSTFPRINYSFSAA